MLDSHGHTVWGRVLAFGVAGVLAGFLYGMQVLDPSSYAWMLHGDAAQHLNGLAFFLAEPWRWPLGALSGFGGPGSVVFTDSIPWLALLLKLLAWPTDWQVFGWWMVLCHALAAALSAYWLQLHRVSSALAVVYGVLLAFAPVILLRAYGHESLMAHFLIVGALVLSLRTWCAWRWGAWLLLCLGVHAYWVVMVGALALGAAMSAGLKGQVRWGWLWVHGLGMGLVMAAGAYVLGYGLGDGVRSAEGFGYYSANLLTWFDPMDWHAFLRSHGRDVALTGDWSFAFPALGHSAAGQYEGFAWLGAGVLTLLVPSLLVLSRAWVVRLLVPSRSAGLTLGTAAQVCTPWPVWCAAALLGVWSWSHVWGFGSYVGLTWPVPQQLWDLLSVFRASGRLIWPLTWLLMLWVCLCASRWRFAWAWALVALALQVLDMSPKLAEFQHRFHVQMPGALAPLKSPVWPAVLERCPRLQLLTPRVQDGSEWAPVAWQAAQAGASMHPAPTARLSAQRELDMGVLLGDLAASRRWTVDQVYVTWLGALGEPKVQGLLQASALALPGRRAVFVDGYWVIASSACFEGAADLGLL